MFGDWIYDLFAIVIALAGAWIAHRMLEAKRRGRFGPPGDEEDGRGR